MWSWRDADDEIIMFQSPRCQYRPYFITSGLFANRLILFLHLCVIPQLHNATVDRETENQNEKIYAPQYRLSDFETYCVQDTARKKLISGTQETQEIDFRNGFHMPAGCAWDRLSEFETDCLTLRQTVPKESRQQKYHKTQDTSFTC